MGWFDDSSSDSEDEKAQRKKKRAAADTTAATAPALSTNGEEEEDPLDSYMKSLNAPSSQTTSGQSKMRAERLDVENEEEATSHWEDKKAGGKSRVPDTHDVDNDTKRAARAALASTFRKASSGKSHQEDYIKLDQVAHDQMQYEPFRRSFWHMKASDVGRSWRSEKQVVCTPNPISDPILDFSELDHVFGNQLLQVLSNKGYQTPTPVQAQTLPLALVGKDCLTTASTGSGKTLAYVWPLLVHVCAQSPLAQDMTGPLGLVLVPTRELAHQVHKQVQGMLPGAKRKTTSMTITGGMGAYPLSQELKKKGGIDIVVATPGRFLDVLQGTKNKKYGVSLRRVTMVVLDEADKMLDMGFESQVTEILRNIRPDRQTMMLSATMGRKVEGVAKGWLAPDFVRISVGRTGKASEHVQQHVHVLQSFEAKKAWLREMLGVLDAQEGQTLVFVASRADVETVAAMIRETNNSLVIDTLHGDRHSTDRQAALRAFAKGQLTALIATDVASRGLDVSNVSTVINFDPAKTLDIHVHRIGRAGRLSTHGSYQPGTAYTLLTPKNVEFARILAQSLEREGTVVSNELRALAASSNNRHHRNHGGHTGWQSTASRDSQGSNKRSRWS